MGWLRAKGLDLIARAMLRDIVEAWLESLALSDVERLYLMNTNSCRLQGQLERNSGEPQPLLVRKSITSG